MQDLRNKTLRGGLANLSGRCVIVLVRVISIMILGRLLTPNDYGLVAMVTSFTGLLTVLSGVGLSQAAIQGQTMTDERASTLFWMNMIIGAALTLVALALAPVAGRFYHEPQLVMAASVVAIGFLFTGAGVQHRVLLTRQMRFGASALIDVIASVSATAIAIVMALWGWEYWALVSTLVSVPLISTLGVWIATGWIPGPPRRGTGVRPLMRFGGAVTLNGLVGYVAANFEKVLLGRFWGAQSVGLYSRAQTLLLFPIDNLNLTVGEVAFAALSRARDDTERLRRYFLKSFALVSAVMAPLSMVCVLYADDLIAVALGPKWADAAHIFRILAPTILVFAVLQPLSWLLNALGLVRRSLEIAIVSACVVMVAVSVGLPYGPHGVAIGYSAAAVLRVVPIAAWAVHGTPLRISEILGTLLIPLAASVGAAVAAYGAHLLLGATLVSPVRLLVQLTIFGAAYVSLLLLFPDQRSLYVDMLRSWKGSAGLTKELRA